MINKENWKENYTHISNEVIDNEKVLRVIKSGKINEYDENTYAKLVDSSFHNGIIEVKMLSRLLKEAPDFARGFIGIAYRIHEDDTKFESFYVGAGTFRRILHIRLIESQTTAASLGNRSGKEPARLLA